METPSPNYTGSDEICRDRDDGARESERKRPRGLVGDEAVPGHETDNMVGGHHARILSFGQDV
jgi:hypothetical protein